MYLLGQRQVGMCLLIMFLARIVLAKSAVLCWTDAPGHITESQWRMYHDYFSNGKGEEQ